MAAPLVFESVKVTPVKGGLRVSWKLGPGAVNGREILVRAYVSPGSTVVPSSELEILETRLSASATSVALVGESGVTYEVSLNYVSGYVTETAVPL